MFQLKGVRASSGIGVVQAKQSLFVSTVERQNMVLCILYAYVKSFICYHVRAGNP